jgi:alkanesulfonate monooxygenase SsuD/methylene tetrahydromethanopterin reductase-like flavin-dependent oxidoreductase (luciferase family)
MEFGIMLPGGGHSIHEGIEIARIAEDRGLASVYCVEAYRSALVPLAAIAANTRRVKVGPYILNAWGRSPWLTSMSAVDCDELSQGRFVLCLGPGNRHINEDKQGLTFQRPAAKMQEYIELVRRMTSARPDGEPLSYSGEFHTLTKWLPDVMPFRQRIPVYAAAVAPAMRRVVGRVADGAALGTLCSPEYLADAIRPDILAAAEQAGRNPEDVGFLMAYFVSVDEDREAARNAVRRAIAGLYGPLPHPYYDYLIREQGFSKVADAALKHVPEGRIEHAIEGMSDDFVDALTAAGNLDDCRRSLQRYEGLTDEIIFVNARGPAPQPGGPGDESAAVRSYITMMACAG